MTGEEFDRRVAEAAARGGGSGYVTDSDRALMAAIDMAWDANPVAAAMLAWNYPRRMESAKARMARIRAIATGEEGVEEAERYAGITCGSCANGRPAVWCDLTKRMYLADAHGDPGDYRCGYERSEDLMATNYEKHFGDPLRVAETLSNAGICWGTLTGEIPCGDPCNPCPMYRESTRLCDAGSVEKWLEWLESEVEE